DWDESDSTLLATVSALGSSDCLQRNFSMEFGSQRKRTVHRPDRRRLWRQDDPSRSSRVLVDLRSPNSHCQYSDSQLVEHNLRRVKRRRQRSSLKLSPDRRATRSPARFWLGYSNSPRRRLVARDGPRRGTAKHAEL